ncbi:hypothetical protein BO78DRAFT_213449 [Aspergillus sclerotiicarbonarius CBS 121057]|uniref:Uncharacterized protein n=1 Tax=Aspergillus sclerotiicarbonarius (strain CBS 121057 / IBT 28362) TaxID=1448318 RepID=A0A319DZY1_ASPSB|nr:hypothetical protein BO78DRAFT_213449 [Aspergillus sclerotiicarbonarius CBS 121057]
MVLKFPKSRSDWEFDLVGLLAILGESIVSEIVQPLTASRTVFLPRLMPAPHALIRPSRRKALPTTSSRGIGVYSPINIQSVPYFAGLIHQFDLLEPYEFREYHVTFSPLGSQSDHDVEKPVATVQTIAPLKLITIGSFLWTAGVLAWAIVLGDGPAVISIVLVSLASSFHSAASFWKVAPLKFSPSAAVTPGDFIFATHEGAFIVVKCTGEVLRALYTSEARCDYVIGGTAYLTLISMGTLLLMMGIVMMSNCSWDMQVILGASYLVLNGLYMLYALTPAVNNRDLHWDLSMFDIKCTTTLLTSSYTRCLWEAIRATRETQWAFKGQFIPDEEAWREWTEKAGIEARDPNSRWDPEAARDRLMIMRRRGGRGTQAMPILPDDP